MWLLLSTKLQRERNKMLLFIGLFYAEDNELHKCNSKHFVDGKRSNIMLFAFYLYLEMELWHFI